MRDDVEALLRSADPYPGAEAPFADGELDARAHAELRALTSAPPARAPARPVRRRAVLVCAVLVIAALAVVVPPRLGGPPALASAATPPLLQAELAAGSDPGPALERIAAAAAGASDIPRSPGTTGWSEWALSTRIDGEQVTSAIVPVTVQRSHRPDRSGTLVVTTGAPSFPDQDYRDAWRAQGEPGKEGTVIRSEEYGPGEFTGMFPTPPPTDDDALHDYLRVGHPIDTIGTAELFVAIADLRREWDLSPAQRAAIARQIAAAPNVLTLGAMTDRLGRTGTAFATDSDYSGLPTRYILILGPAGQVLSWEAVLTTTPGKLDVIAPSVISYTAWTTTP